MKITLKKQKTGKKVTLAKKPKPKYNRPRYA